MRFFHKDLIFLCVALLTAGALAALNPWLMLAPLIVYATIHITAAFFPGLSYFLPIISNGPRSRTAVALTFDDGPHAETTPRLLDLLDRYNLKTTFFVIGTAAQAHADLITKILQRGHDLGNHSMHHDVFLALRMPHRIEREIDDCQRALRAFGVEALAFRPPVGITPPSFGPVLARHGLFCLAFSCRANDWGNRSIGRLSTKILARVRPGDIILLHDRPVRPPATTDEFLSHIEAIILGLRAKGLDIVPLAELIGRPVMRKIV
jgi:Predicted xylanase/chitin deacetylase